MKPFDYSRVKQYKFALWMKPVIKLIFLTFFRIKVIGRENIPQNGGVIVASNHISGVDPAFVYIFMKTPLHYMSKHELFEKPIYAWIYRHLNAFPVTRGRVDKRAIKYAIDVIKQDGALGIFPEGTRSKDHTPQTAKAGVALIARETGASVLPVSIYSQGRTKPFSKVTVRFGEVIPYDAFAFGAGSKSIALKEASKLIMNDIKALWALKHKK